MKKLALPVGVAHAQAFGPDIDDGVFDPVRWDFLSLNGIFRRPVRLIYDGSDLS